MIARSESATVKLPVVRFDLRQEHAFEEQVADLAAQRVVIAAIDRVEHLVGFFEHESAQRLDRLLAIPRAPPGPRSRAMMSTSVWNSRRRTRSRPTCVGGRSGAARVRRGSGSCGALRARFGHGRLC